MPSEYSSHSTTSYCLNTSSIKLANTTKLELQIKTKKKKQNLNMHTISTTEIFDFI